jgi:hypothetical protein
LRPLQKELILYASKERIKNYVHTWSSKINLLQTV